MTIEATGPETRQTPTVIYPIGREAVTAVLNYVFENPAYRTGKDYLSAKALVIKAENPYAIQHLMEIGDRFSPDESTLFKVGTLLAYEFFKQRAGDRKLPVLRREFVDLREQMEEQRATRAYGRNPNLQSAGRSKEEVMQRQLFFMLERETYQALDEKMTVNESVFYDSMVFSGIVASYFLFRDGFSNSEFWEPD